MNEGSLYQELIENFPELRDSFDPNTGIYCNFGELGLSIRDEIVKKQFGVEFLDRAFRYLNNLANSADREVLNLLSVGVLEILTDSEDSVCFARKNLNGKALIMLEDLVKRI